MTAKAKTAPAEASPSERPPREPTPANRRAIIRALEETFDDKTGCYCERGTTDDTVARELGVPRKWVADIREAFLGPIRADPAVLKLEAELAILRKTSTAAIEAALAAAAKIEAAIAEADDLVARLRITPTV